MRPSPAVQYAPHPAPLTWNWKRQDFIQLFLSFEISLKAFTNLPFFFLFSLFIVLIISYNSAFVRLFASWHAWLSVSDLWWLTFCLSGCMSVCLFICLSACLLVRVSSFKSIFLYTTTVYSSRLLCFHRIKAIRNSCSTIMIRFVLIYKSQWSDNFDEFDFYCYQ